MFLNRLTVKEKNAFLEIAHYVAGVDEHVSAGERSIIDKYCMEMQIDDVEYDAGSFQLRRTLDAFEDVEHRKIALLEIMALVFSDGTLHAAEQSVIDEMVSYFELNPNLAIVYKEWAKSVLALYVQGEALVHL